MNNIASEHAFPTDLVKNENPCDYFGPPYINNCNFDGVGSMFTHIIDKQLNKKTQDWQSKGQLLLFDQTEFISPLYVFNTSSLDELGYVYIPTECKNN